MNEKIKLRKPNVEKSKQEFPKTKKQREEFMKFIRDSSKLSDEVFNRIWRNVIHCSGRSDN